MKAEIAAISKVCKQYDLILFMDGARLGFAMASDKARFKPREHC